MTPPTMAPMFDFLACGGVGVGDGVTVTDVTLEVVVVLLVVAFPSSVAFYTLIS
jgi:hypothetical protein